MSLAGARSFWAGKFASSRAVRQRLNWEVGIPRAWALGGWYSSLRLTPGAGAGTDCVVGIRQPSNWEVRLVFLALRGWEVGIRRFGLT